MGLSLALMLPMASVMAAPAAAPDIDATVTLEEPVQGPVALSWGAGRLLRREGTLRLGVDEVRISINGLSEPAHVSCWAYSLRTVFGTVFTAALDELEVEERRGGTATGERQVIKRAPDAGSWFEWVADPSEPGDYTYVLSSEFRLGVHSCIVTNL